MTNKTEAPNDLDRAFAELMALTPSEIAERVKQYADHPFAKTLRELNQVDDAADELSRLQDENERQRCSIKALAARRNTMSDRIHQLEAEKVHLLDALKDIASGEILRSHCTGPHCVEELGVATADELSSRAAGALDWDAQTAGATEARAQLAQRQVHADSYDAVWDAELGRVAIRFVDRAGDVHPGIDDAETICREFHAAMFDVIDRMPHVKAMLAASPTPPQRESLGDQQITAALIAWFGHDLVIREQAYRVAMRNAIEAAHGIKGEEDGK